MPCVSIFVLIFMCIPPFLLVLAKIYDAYSVLCFVLRGGLQWDHLLTCSIHQPYEVFIIYLLIFLAYALCGG